MKKKQLRTLIIAALVVLLAVTSILNLEIEPPDPPVTSPAVSTPVESGETPSPSAPSKTTPEPSSSGAPVTDAPSPSESPVETSSVPTAEPTPTPAETTPTAAPSEEPSQEPEEPEKHVCTLEIRCDTVVDTTKLENQAVAPYVPADGIILAATEFEFTPGESVFDVLLRATREKGIQMEFRDDQLYSGKYIEGINYLYEFDGGPLSGWMYHVNGQFPNHGCAAIYVEDNDAIVWVYTCDLGVDVGDNSVWW